LQLRIASQIYDTVDAHIRELDKDLQQFDHELSEDRDKLGLKEGETARRALGLDSGPPAVEQPAATQAEQRTKRKYTRRKGRAPSTDAGECRQCSMSYIHML
jgi:hypothetical protein